MEEADLRRHIAEPLKGEFRAALAAVGETILAFPPEEWCSGEEKRYQPIRQAGHLLLGIEQALGGHKSGVGKRFGVPIESFKAEFAPEDCPSPEEFLPWIKEVEQIAMDHIERAVTLSVTGAPKKHPPLNRPTYLLRHTVV
ncbi:MAG: hypothetical protein QF886_15650, partial [Planctomycetota bacterium]|nr:hypothetical protein [Planctomycetota bacterium]